jgi:hypothetical protein
MCCTVRSIGILCFIIVVSCIRIVMFCTVRSIGILCFIIVVSCIRIVMKHKIPIERTVQNITILIHETTIMKHTIPIERTVQNITFIIVVSCIRIVMFCTVRSIGILCFTGCFCCVYPNRDISYCSEQKHLVKQKIPIERTVQNITMG